MRGVADLSTTDQSALADLADVERVLAGDVNAFEGIVRRWQGPLVNMAWRYCRLDGCIIGRVAAVVAAGASDSRARVALAGNPYSMAKTAYTAASRVTLFGSMATGADAGCPATENELITALG